MKAVYFIETDDDGIGIAVVSYSLGKAKSIALKYDSLGYGEFISLKGKKLDINPKNLKLGIIPRIDGLKLGAYSWIEEECSKCHKTKNMYLENLVNSEFICSECSEPIND